MQERDVGSVEISIDRSSQIANLLLQDGARDTVKGVRSPGRSVDKGAGVAEALADALAGAFGKLVWLGR